MPDDFQFPTTSERVAIVGKTGSGKTTYAAWLLSHAPLDQMPYIIMDFKGEKMFRDMPYAKEISLAQIPKDPGLYIVRPDSWQEEEVENFLRAIWKQENIGLYIDEAYMIDKYSKAYRALLTQGRSKNIPMINLTQRPVDVSRFMFTEAEHHAVFYLNDERDRDIVGRYMPLDIEERLPDYWCYWYDVGRNKNFRIQPVPDRDAILKRFEEKLRPPEPEKPGRIYI